ncbi:iron-sulfur cluster assembly accessory protein [Halobacillus amylolyticus]|uniref:Adhesin n=1 Tax=Halobacillus amylolyticus TaxID=2932259 RepID=A0ABY4HIA9_9BACI|nr:adhesin [Halobacillus amylolyticus]UOR13160.1 adhesin [Halobacillus amylolyticus]
MKITEEAKQTLTKLIGERGAEGIRVHSAGAGCCGPQIGLSLDHPEETDRVEEVNGVRVAIDQQVMSTVDEVTLDKDGEQFVLLGLDNCC